MKGSPNLQTQQSIKDHKLRKKDVMDVANTSNPQVTCLENKC
jgi:hypothetical protein